QVGGRSRHTSGWEVADVVDRDVDAAEPGDRFVHHRLHLIVVAQVLHDRDGLSAFGRDLGHGRRGLVGPDVDDSDRRASPRQPARDLATDAGAGAGDERAFAGEVDRYHVDASCRVNTAMAWRTVSSGSPSTVSRPSARRTDSPCTVAKMRRYQCAAVASSRPYERNTRLSGRVAAAIAALSSGSSPGGRSDAA